MQVLELFKAADKYDVAGLVKECVQIFKKITHAADVAPLLQVSCCLEPLQALQSVGCVGNCTQAVMYICWGLSAAGLLACRKLGSISSMAA